MPADPNNPWGSIFAPTTPTAPDPNQTPSSSSTGPLGSSTPSASQSGGTSWWGKMTPEAQGALINAGAQIGGGILSGIGKDKSDQAQMNYNYAQLRQQAADSAAQRTIQAAQSNPLAIQAARQKMAVMGAILPGLRNVQVSSNIPGMNQFIPQITGGLRLPDGGLPQSVLDMYSPQSVANAEGEFWKQMAGSVVPQDLTKVGYGAAGQQGTDTAMAARQQAIGNATNPMGGTGTPSGVGGTATAAQVAANPAPAGYTWKGMGTDGTGQTVYMLVPNQQKQGGGWLSTLGKIGLAVGGGALGATGIGGALGSSLIGAGVGAGEGALNGGGWEGALEGAAAGGLTSGVNAMRNPVAPQSFGSALQHTLENPQFLANTTGQVLGGKTGMALQLGSMALPGSFSGYNKPPAMNDPRLIDGGFDPATMGGTGGVPGDGMPAASATPPPTGIQAFLQKLAGQQGQPFGGGGGGNFVQPPGEAEANWQKMIAPLLQLLQQKSGQRPGMTPQQAPQSGQNWAQIIQQLLQLRNPQTPPVMY